MDGRIKLEYFLSLSWLVDGRTLTDCFRCNCAVYLPLTGRCPLCFVCFLLAIRAVCAMLPFLWALWNLQWSHSGWSPNTLAFVTLSLLIFPLLVANLSLSLRLFLWPDLLPAGGTACPSLGPPCLPELWLSGTNRQRITTPLLLSWTTINAVHQSINKLADLQSQWIFQSVRRQGII